MFLFRNFSFDDLSQSVILSCGTSAHEKLLITSPGAETAANDTSASLTCRVDTVKLFRKILNVFKH